MTKVRSYAPGDRSAVEVLWARVFSDDPPRNDPALILARKVAERDGLVFVAEDDGRVVGAIMAGYDGYRGWLYHLAVDDSHRHRGIGAALVRAAEVELVSRGCRKVNLQVRSTNTEVITFYEALGYAVEDRVGLGRVIDG